MPQIVDPEPVAQPSPSAAGRKVARRQLESRSTLPPGVVNTRSSVASFVFAGSECLAKGPVEGGAVPCAGGDGDAPWAGR
jgi:hypothetical protein